MVYLEIKFGQANGVAGAKMLRLISLDRVILSLPISYELFYVVVGQLEFLCGEYGYKFKCKYLSNVENWIADLIEGDEHLRVCARRAYKYRWIEFSFTGELDFHAFHEKLLLLQEYGLANAMVEGRVKRLELALDVPGLHTSMLLAHCVGVRSGCVRSNALGTGFSYYLGSRNGSKQFIVYDKNQELSDTGKPHGPGEMIRIELRLYKAMVPLVHMVAMLKEKDPFSDFYVASRATMLGKPTKLKSWPLLISACAKEGVPNALKIFPEQKKTFINSLKEHSLGVKPRAKDFDSIFARLLAAAKQMQPLGPFGQYILQ